MKPFRLRRQDGDAISCARIVRVLQAYIDGEASELDARRVARHLESCRDCGLEAETYWRVKHALRRLGPGIDEGTVQRVKEFVRGLGEGLGEEGLERG